MADRSLRTDVLDGITLAFDVLAFLVAPFIGAVTAIVLGSELRAIPSSCFSDTNEKITLLGRVVVDGGVMVVAGYLVLGTVLGIGDAWDLPLRRRRLLALAAMVLLVALGGLVIGLLQPDVHCAG